MANEYDVIIIGAGHNGLTTAASLAQKGKKVLVVEKRNTSGGLCGAGEFHPGFSHLGLINDTSTVHPKLVSTLDLQSHGLDFHAERGPIHLFSEVDQSIRLDGDMDKTYSQIGKYSKSDAEAYKAYRTFIDKIAGFIRPLLRNMPPDLNHFGGKQIFELAKKGYGLKKLGKKTMMELLKVAPMSVQDFLDQYFETEFLKAGLASPSIWASFNGPRASFTALNLILWECTAHSHIKSGPHGLVKALQNACQKAGVEILTDSKVKRIIISQDRIASGVELEDGTIIKATTVGASCNPKNTFLDLIDPTLLELAEEHRFLNYRSRGTTAKINFAVKNKIQFKGYGINDVENARLVDSFMQMEKAFDPVKYGQVTDNPILDVYLPTVHNPGIAPEGSEVVSVLVHFVPYHLKTGWSNENRDKLIKTIQSKLSNSTR